MEHNNSATSMWIFNNCILYHQSKNKIYFYFINKEISQQNKKLLKQNLNTILLPNNAWKANKELKGIGRLRLAKKVIKMIWKRSFILCGYNCKNTYWRIFGEEENN